MATRKKKAAKDDPTVGDISYRLAILRLAWDGATLSSSYEHAKAEAARRWVLDNQLITKYGAITDAGRAYLAEYGEAPTTKERAEIALEHARPSPISRTYISLTDYASVILKELKTKAEGMALDDFRDLVLSRTRSLLSRIRDQSSSSQEDIDLVLAYVDDNINYIADRKARAQAAPQKEKEPEPPKHDECYESAEAQEWARQRRAGTLDD